MFNKPASWIIGGELSATRFVDKFMQPTNFPNEGLFAILKRI